MELQINLLCNICKKRRLYDNILTELHNYYILFSYDYNIVITPCWAGFKIRWGSKDQAIVACKTKTKEQNVSHCVDQPVFGGYFLLRVTHLCEHQLSSHTVWAAGLLVWHQTGKLLLHCLPLGVPRQWFTDWFNWHSLAWFPSRGHRAEVDGRA